MTVSIDPEYQTYEQVAANIRTALGTGVKVFESVPFLPNSEDFDKLVLADFESAKLAYFWVVFVDGVDPEQIATMHQRERIPATVYGYMIRSDKPGEPDASDASVSVPFASGTATAGSTTTLTDSGAAFTVDEFANSHELWVTYADGTVDHRRILSNTATALTVRQAFGTAISAGVTYQIWLRPTEWIMREQARKVLDALTTNRSGGGAWSSNLPNYRIESIFPMYERGWWRVTFAQTKDISKGKSYA